MFFDIMKNEAVLNEEEKIESIKSTILLIDKHERNLFKYLCKMLNTVSLYHDKNKMTVRNLARVWAPNFLWSTSISPLDAHRNIDFNQHAELLTELIIAEANYLFDWPSEKINPPISHLSIEKNQSVSLNLPSYSQSVTVIPVNSQDSTITSNPPPFPNHTNTSETERNPESTNCHYNQSISSTVPISSVSISATVCEAASASEVYLTHVDSTETEKLSISRSVTFTGSCDSTSSWGVTLADLPSLRGKKGGTPRPLLRHRGTFKKNLLKNIVSIDEIPSSNTLAKFEQITDGSRSSQLMDTSFNPQSLIGVSAETFGNRSINKSTSFVQLRQNLNNSVFRSFTEKKGVSPIVHPKRTITKTHKSLMRTKRTTTTLPYLTATIRRAKKLTCYYQCSDMDTINSVSNFFSENYIIPSKIRDENISPIQSDEAVKLTQAHRTLLILNKIGAIRFLGAVSELSEDQIKTLILRKTNSLKSPAIFIKRDSMMILGWSEDIWSDYLLPPKS
jgi:hypothetical protein